MKTTSTFGIHFKLRTERMKDGKAPIFLGLVVNGEKIYLALKNYYVEISNWDKNRGAGKRNTAEGKKINEYLEDIRIILRDRYQELLSKGRFITADLIKEAFLGNGNPELTLNTLTDYHNEQAKAVLEWSTLKHYYVTQRYLQKFLLKQYQKKDIFLHEIN